MEYEIFQKFLQARGISRGSLLIAEPAHAASVEGKRLGIDGDDITYNEKNISHVIDVGANYWSVWNWHNESAGNVLSYYEKYPDPIDHIGRGVGYPVRPSFIWSFKREGTPGLVVGLGNNGISAVPGVLRLTLFSDDGKVNVTGASMQAIPSQPVSVRQCC